MPTPAKISRDDWPDICDGLDRGQTQARLAVAYDCSRQAISKLVNSPAFVSFRQERRRQVAQRARRDREAGRGRVETAAFRSQERGESAARQPPSRLIHSDAIDPETGERFPDAREA